MKVILLKDVKGVGRRFDEVQVSDGYANNSLLPKNLAVLANNAGRARAKQLQEQSESRRAAEDKVQNEKLAKRAQKHEELEKFRKSQQREPSS